jgi:hypothetical protein
LSLFSAAGLDPSKWEAAQPAWTPPVYSDARAAWAGSLPERPNIPMRIEAAAYRGKPVYFELIGPWTRPSRMQPYYLTASLRVFLILFEVFFLLVLIGSALVARRNLRLGRGDRQGAFRLALFVFAAWTVAWVFGAHHVSDFEEFPLFVEFLVWGSGFSYFTWLLYIALEPYVRRRWPAALVSWSRLLAGSVRDPLVGRDVLVGCLSGASLAALGRLWWFVPGWLGYPPPRPLAGPDWQFLGARTIIAYLSDSLINAPLFWLAALFVLVLLWALLRRQWAAALAFVLLLAGFLSTLEGFAPNVLVFDLVTSGVFAFLLMRFGLLSVVANFIFWNILEGFPLTTQGSVWYAGISLAGILLMAAIALYAFHTSLGGRPAFGGAVLEE